VGNLPELDDISTFTLHILIAILAFSRHASHLQAIHTASEPIADSLQKRKASVIAPACAVLVSSIEATTN
jgi:hypothetical protein